MRAGNMRYIELPTNFMAFEKGTSCPLQSYGIQVTARFKSQSSMLFLEAR